MGFGFKDWLGSFYPPDLPSDRFLRYYSQYFNAVEADTTFYGTPRLSTVKKWKSETPSNFIFCPKLPKKITHENALFDSSSHLLEFLNTVQFLENKLGAILIQLGPDFSYKYALVFKKFISNLPKEFRFAVEFRHESWETPEIADLLHQNNICWASIDYTIMSKDIIKTADFLYVRWIGFHGQFKKKDHLQKDTGNILQEWYQKISEKLFGTRNIFGFFNNDFAGHSPASCNEFKKLVGLPIKTPSIPKQPPLF